MLIWKLAVWTMDKVKMHKAHWSPCVFVAFCRHAFCVAFITRSTKPHMHTHTHTHREFCEHLFGCLDFVQRTTDQCFYFILFIIPSRGWAKNDTIEHKNAMKTKLWNMIAYKIWHTSKTHNMTKEAWYNRTIFFIVVGSDHKVLILCYETSGDLRYQP